MQKLGSGIAYPDALDLVRRHDEATLVDTLGAAQLIGAPELADDEGDEWSFQTRAISRLGASMRLGIDLGRAYVFPVRKARSTFADTILVGRASTSDVFIDDPSISKLHARIRRHVHGREGETWTISDAGSTNGTAIGERAVAVDEPLAYGTRLRIGKWTFRFERLADTIAILENP